MNGSRLATGTQFCLCAFPVQFRQVCLTFLFLGLTPNLHTWGQTGAPAVPQATGIDFERARLLIQRQRAGETLSAEETTYLERARAARRDQPAGPGANLRSQPPVYRPPRATIGLTPLNEMTASDRYQGEDGGLYGAGQNVPPDEHRQRAEQELAQIVPLDARGTPGPTGRVVFISISMSNASQEFSRFKQLADHDPDKSAHLTIVDCAQEGQAMAAWADPKAPAWSEAERRLANNQVTNKQVQVAWIKLANRLPTGDLTVHGKRLQRDTQAVLQEARRRFPNLRLAYLSSRIYAGHANTNASPEPYAYESAFVVRRLIQNQISGQPELQFTPDRADSPAANRKPKAPLLLWGPYLWADGTTPRQADHLTYTREDFAPDGTHPSGRGRDKVAGLLLQFFKTDPLAKSWFTRHTTAVPTHE